MIYYPNRSDIIIGNKIYSYKTQKKVQLMIEKTSPSSRLHEKRSGCGKHLLLRKVRDVEVVM